MKRFSAMVLITVISFSLFLGCGQKLPDDAQIYGKTIETSSEVSAEAVTVNFFGLKADAMNLTAIENAIHGLMKEHSDMEMEYEGVKGSAYEEVLELCFEGNTMDDIFMVHHHDVLKISRKGKLADLSELSATDSFNEMAKIQFIEKDGSIYFLPASISAYPMYVNLDMPEEYEFDVPTNWKEFSEQCGDFKSKGVMTLIGNNYADIYSLMSAKRLYSIYQKRNTAEIIETFNSGELDMMEYFEQGVRMVGTMFEQGWFDREEVLNTKQTSDDFVLFAEGARPFMITGGWAGQRLMAMNPKCFYTIYPFSILEDGGVLLMNIDTCFSINAESDGLEEAKAFAEYITWPDVVYEFCDTQSCYPPLKDDRTPSDQTIAPAAEYLFNRRNIIRSGYRWKLPLDSAEQIVGGDEYG